MVTSLFVYGTLMPGRLRWALLEEAAVSWRPDTVAGRLYDTGEGWPAARFCRPLDAEPLEPPGATGSAGSAGSAGDAVIPGWVVVVEAWSLGSLLPLLDEVETGFRRVRVQTGGGAVAWGYEVLVRPAGWPAIERWDALEER